MKYWRLKSNFTALIEPITFTSPCVPRTSSDSEIQCLQQSIRVPSWFTNWEFYETINNISLCLSEFRNREWINGLIRWTSKC
jgi:hypothetical protein